jgi:phosphoribosylamine--glycine ligase
LAADPAVTALVAAPGNPGLAGTRLTGSGRASVRSVVITDPAAVADLAVAEQIDLVVVGPEAPLVAGVADALRAKAIACFGPSAQAAQLEGSKAYAKEVMAATGVPTARAYTCTAPYEVAAALDEFGPPYVVKDDGLAAGKGVVVTDDRRAALAHAAGCARVVVEEYLDGPEFSLFVVCDGTDGVALLPAQDYKRAGDGDTGPNTGGMGAYAPLDWLPAGTVDAIMASTVRPVLAEMSRRGAPFVGLLYVGLAYTARGPKVVEFNCRLGDPDGQVVLALLETPLATLLAAAAGGRLAEHPPLRWRGGSAVAVVLASAGYPDRAETGDEISGADQPGVLQAGTALRDGRLVSAGGRVLCCVATGPDLRAARTAAYGIVERVRLRGGQYRTDIASAAIAGRISVGA